LPKKVRDLYHLAQHWATLEDGTPVVSSTSVGFENYVFLFTNEATSERFWNALGNNVVFSNNVMLAGHCTVGDYAILGGGAAVIQFARVGTHAFVGGMSGLENDLIPYGMALGNRAYLSGLNIVGLQRRGFSRDDIHDLRRAYRALFAAEGTLAERTEDVAKEFGEQPIVQEIIAFIRAGGKRSLCTPKEATEV